MGFDTHHLANLWHVDGGKAQEVTFISISRQPGMCGIYIVRVVQEVMTGEETRGEIGSKRRNDPARQNSADLTRCPNYLYPAMVFDIELKTDVFPSQETLMGLGLHFQRRCTGTAVGLFFGKFGPPRPCRSLLQKPASILHGVRTFRAKDLSSVETPGRASVDFKMIPPGNYNFAGRKRYKDAGQCTLHTTNSQQVSNCTSFTLDTDLSLFRSSSP
jgi:hypothetical protein